MKNTIKKIRLFNKVASYIYIKIISLLHKFDGSQNYWETRYRLKGNSGDGSYNRLCHFKAKIINNFVAINSIEHVIDFGCGDGNQLKQANYPNYLGFDISSIVIEKCRSMFSQDKKKNFKLIIDYSNETAPLSISLDVIYHLVEDDVFSSYMEMLFNSSTDYIIIYSSNTDVQAKIQAPHVKHRKFSDWVEVHYPEWRLVEYIPNEFPYSEKDQSGSFADFYIYKKIKE